MSREAEYRVVQQQYPWLFPEGTDLEPESYETRYNRAYIFARAMGIRFPHLYATTYTFKEALR